MFDAAFASKWKTSFHCLNKLVKTTIPVLWDVVFANDHPHDVLTEIKKNKGLLNKLI